MPLCIVTYAANSVSISAGSGTDSVPIAAFRRGVASSVSAIGIARTYIVGKLDDVEKG